MIDDFRRMRWLGQRVRFRKWLILVPCLVCAVMVIASQRRHYTDAEAVSRAELMVVGRMKEGSLALISRGTNYPEQRMELLISEVLKGETSATSLVVRIEGCLVPLVGGYYSNRQWGFTIDWRGSSGATNYPKDMVQIICTGFSTFDETLLPTGDIRTNHVWLLRHEDLPGMGKLDRLSVFDPEDIQRIARKEELLGVLKSLPTTGPK